MAWIESHQTLLNHPKLLHLASLMEWDIDTAIAKLHRLWWWCLDYAPDGNVSRHSADMVALSIGLSADMGEKLINSLLESKFLVKNPKKNILVHDWLDYAGRYLRDSKYKRTPEKYKEIINLYKGVVSRHVLSKSHNVSRLSAVPNQPNLTNQPNQTNHKQSKSATRDFIASYCEAWKAKYGENPIITKKEAGIAQRLIAIPNIDWLMERFFESTDPFIVKNGHSLSIVESQLNKLLATGGNRDNGKYSEIKAWLKEKENATTGS